MRLRIIVLILALATLAATAIGGYFYYQAVQASALAQVEGDLTETAGELKDQILQLIAEYQTEVRLLVRFEELEGALKNQTPEALERATRILTHFSARRQGDVCYLMDREGNTIASSNYNQPDSFVGKNYSFRPYFSAAIEGNDSTYMGVGVTSDERGAYFGYPVRIDGSDRPTGVAVIKASIHNLERIISSKRHDIVLFVHDSGLIFMSSRSEWILHTLWRLTDNELARIAATKQFGKGPWKWTGLEQKSGNRAIDRSGETYLINEANLEGYPSWRIVALAPFEYSSQRIYPLWKARTEYGVLVVLAIVTGAIVVLFTLALRDIHKRQLAEQALRESEKELGLTLEATTEGIWQWDLETNQLHFSDRWYTMLGYQPGEFRASYEAWKSLLHPDDRGRAVSVAESFLETKPDWYHNEFRFRSKDGQYRWIDSRASVVEWNDRGKALKLIGNYQDITDRKRAEDALRESGERLQTIFETSPAGIILVNPEGLITFANRRMGDLFSRPCEDLIGTPYVDLLHPSQRSIGYEKMLSLMKGEIDHVSLERRYLAQGGGEFIGHLSGRRLLRPDGSLGGLVGIITDITDRKQAEEALTASEARYRGVFENAAIGIDVVDSRGRFLQANDSLARMLGYSRNELMNLTIFDVTHPDDVADSMIKHETMVHGEMESYRFEKRYIKKDGAVLWAEVSVSSVRGPDGAYLETIGVLSDVTERKKAEEALRERERAWATLVNNLPGFVYRCANDRDWTMEYISEGCRQVTGYGPEDFVGNKTLSYNDIVHPDWRSPLWDEWQEVISRKTVFQDEYPIIVKGGEIRWVWERGQGVFGQDGRLLSLEGFITDITERKEAEKQIRMNETRLQSLYDIGQYRETSKQDLLDFALNEAIKLTGSKVGYIYHYDEEERLFELNTWSKDVMKQCEVAEPQTLYELERTGIWGEAVRQRKPIIVNDFQAPNPLKKGYPEGHVELHNFITLPVIFGERIVAVVGMGNKDSAYDNGDVLQLSLLMDSLWRITEAKRVEAEQRRLATAVEHAAEGVMITNIDGTIEYVNQACLEMTGYSREELLGQTPRILKSGKQDEAFYKKFWRTVAAGQVWAGRIINRRQDGTLYTEDSTVSPVRDASGTVVNFVALKRDITQHLELSKQLLQAQKMESIGTLAGVIAHDFNNLLQVTMGYSELLLQEKSENDQDYSDLSRILHAARSGSELVRSLLAFSRKSEPNPIPLDLNQEIRHVEKLLHRTSPRMIEIRLDLADDLDRIDADPAQIEQIIMNLAVNAKDAMGEKGILTVRTENVTLDQDYCKLKVEARPGDYVLLSISDTGHGIDSEILEHIFEPFYTTKEVGRGTGLGLASAYGLVQQHGGHIDCESEVGQGATFKIYLPVVHSIEEPAVEETGVMPAFGTETVLLVDDEDLVRELGERILKRNGYNVLTAANGEEALEVYEREKDRIAMIILDLIMPAMGGKDCLKKVLEIDPDARVLIASGYAADTSTKECIELGAKGFVAKPFRFKELLRQVRKTLDKA
jgi:two-component system, cell cycle sensor histidine kinase and response regulator CckA